jgi:hypothetical protein
MSDISYLPARRTPVNSYFVGPTAGMQGRVPDDTRRNLVRWFMGLACFVSGFILGSVL